jgi:hypothetical protein
MSTDRSKRLKTLRSIAKTGCGVAAGPGEYCCRGQFCSGCERLIELLEIMDATPAPESPAPARVDESELPPIGEPQHLCRVCLRPTDVERRGDFILYQCHPCKQLWHSAAPASAEAEPEEESADQHMQWASDGDDLEASFNSLHAYAKRLEERLAPAQGSDIGTAPDLEHYTIHELCDLIEEARTVARAKQRKMQAACYCHRSPPCHYCTEGGRDDIP